MRVQSDANTTGVVTWLHGDMLGSASVATDASGNKIAGSDTRYMPYGEVRSGFAGSGLPTDRRYTGQISVAGGLIDMNARALDPLLGRFISADTIVPNFANPQSLNRYAYSLNAPMNYADPSGHCSIPITVFGFSLGTVSLGSAACPWDKRMNPPIFDNPLDVDETPPVIDNPQGKDLPDAPVFDGDHRANGDMELPKFDILPTPKPSAGPDIITDPRAPSKLGQIESKTNPGDRRLDELCKMYGCTKEERRRIGREIEKEKQGAPRGSDGKGSDLTDEEMIDIIEQEIAKRPAERQKPDPVNESDEDDRST